MLYFRIWWRVKSILKVKSPHQHNYSILKATHRFKALFEVSQDSILLLDLKTAKIEDANPFIIQLLDFSNEELYGSDTGGNTYRNYLFNL